MNIQDIVNGSFEIFGGFLLWYNVKTILRDKKVAGVSWIPTAFFASWGLWNLYFYPSVNCWWSFVGGLNVVSANIVWVILMIYYTSKQKCVNCNEPENNCNKCVR